MHHRRITPHSAGTLLLDSSHYDELQERTPTIERPFQVYLPPGLRVDAPTMPKCCSGLPNVRPFSPITPVTPTRNPQSYVNLYPHPLMFITPPGPAPPRAPGEDLDSFHVRAIYAAPDVSGVRRDVDGEARRSLACAGGTTAVLSGCYLCPALHCQVKS